MKFKLLLQNLIIKSHAKRYAVETKFTSFYYNVMKKFIILKLTHTLSKCFACLNIPIWSRRKFFIQFMQNEFCKCVKWVLQKFSCEKVPGKALLGNCGWNSNNFFYNLAKQKFLKYLTRIFLANLNFFQLTLMIVIWVYKQLFKLFRSNYMIRNIYMWQDSNSWPLYL